MSITYSMLVPNAKEKKKIEEREEACVEGGFTILGYLGQASLKW